MIKGIFILFSDSFSCSNQVDIKIVPATKGVPRHTMITAYNCYGALCPEIHQDVECAIKYEVVPPMRFTANVKEYTTEHTMVLRLTSGMSKGNVNQLLSTIAKLI